MATTTKPDASGVRADLWLWSVRLFKTRALATDACRAGKVFRLGHPIKPATPLRPGDLLAVPSDLGQREIRVDQLLARRAGAPVAATCYTDLTDPARLAAARDAQKIAAAHRPHGLGRPTKLERRDTDRLRSALREMGYPSPESAP